MAAVALIASCARPGFGWEGGTCAGCARLATSSHLNASPLAGQAVSLIVPHLPLARGERVSHGQLPGPAEAHGTR